MEDNLNNRIVIILAILSCLFFFGTLSSCNSAMRQKAGRDKEMAARLQLEEKMNKFSQERSALEEKIKAKEKEAEEAKAALVCQRCYPSSEQAGRLMRSAFELHRVKNKDLDKSYVIPLLAHSS